MVDTSTRKPRSASSESPAVTLNENDDQQPKAPVAISHHHCTFAVCICLTSPAGSPAFSSSTPSDTAVGDLKSSPASALGSVFESRSQDADQDEAESSIKPMPTEFAGFDTHEEDLAGHGEQATVDVQASLSPELSNVQSGVCDGPVSDLPHPFRVATDGPPDLARTSFALTL